MTIYDAAVRYHADGVPLLVIAGKEYGSGSSRDWAAKGTMMLGVRAVIAESYERIHRSNLIGMGVLPLEFPAGGSRESLGLSGEELFEIRGIATGLEPRSVLSVEAVRADGSKKVFQALCRIDTPVELDYYRHGGILPFVLRQLL
jgi:aconitate hydratase